jgi:hypothetical protein
MSNVKTRGGQPFQSKGIKTLKGNFPLINGTVKPVYNGHPWDSKKVAVVQKAVVSCRLKVKGQIVQKVVVSCRLFRYNSGSDWVLPINRWPLFRGGC